MDFSIMENETTLKSKEKYIKDDYFNLLVNYAVKFHDCYDVHEIIKNLFELYSIDEYKTFFENKILSNTKYNEVYFEIYNLFCEWKPYSYYNMGNCRGAFLEEFTYHLLKKLYDTGNVYKESNIILDDYSSHNWDVILIFNDIFKAIECKFSSYSIQTKHVNQIKGFKNKFNKFNVYLVSYDYKDAILDALTIITNNNPDEILDMINIISIENLIKENPFEINRFNSRLI
ncbi:MAG: hypothetical protein BZ137_02000 [Methanosphaera sp. rholeuAM130]|nr:MAG: hypothetical protein BZ137_02000 [Methanosphaera sp. rholeuAM130]